MEQSVENEYEFEPVHLPDFLVRFISGGTREVSSFRIYFLSPKNLHPVANSSNKETNSTDFLTWSWHMSIIFGWQANISQTSPQSTEFRHLWRLFLQEGFACNWWWIALGTTGGIRVEDEGMNLKKRTFFSQDPWVPTWICQKHQVHLGTVYHSLIPYVFFDILLGKWHMLRWIRQVPKATRMYWLFFNLECPWVCWFGAWKMFQTYAPKWWCLSSWWFQPTWKILVKIEIFPK